MRQCMHDSPRSPSLDVPPPVFSSHEVFYRYHEQDLLITIPVDVLTLELAWWAMLVQ